MKLNLNKKPELDLDDETWMNEGFANNSDDEDEFQKMIPVEEDDFGPIQCFEEDQQLPDFSKMNGGKHSSTQSGSSSGSNENGGFMTDANTKGKQIDIRKGISIEKRVGDVSAKQEIDII